MEYYGTDYEKLIQFLEITKARFNYLIDKENGDLRIIISDDMKPLLGLFQDTYIDVEQRIDRCLESILHIPYEYLERHGFTGNHLDLKLKQVETYWENVAAIRSDPLRNFDILPKDKKEPPKEEKSRWENFKDKLRRNWYKFLKATDNCIFESLNDIINSMPGASGIFGMVKEWKNSVEIAIEDR